MRVWQWLAVIGGLFVASLAVVAVLVVFVFAGEQIIDWADDDATEEAGTDDGDAGEGDADDADAADDEDAQALALGR